MPRMGRVVLPNYPHHVVQRGHNRQIVFAEPADFKYYLETLAEFKEEYAIKVYGFCLMTNHVHLVLQPGERVAGLGQLMKRLAGRQTRYMNRQEQRSGTLWTERGQFLTLYLVISSFSEPLGASLSMVLWMRDMREMETPTRAETSFKGKLATRRSR